MHNVSSGYLYYYAVGKEKNNKYGKDVTKFGIVQNIKRNISKPDAR